MGVTGADISGALGARNPVKGNTVQVSRLTDAMPHHDTHYKLYNGKPAWRAQTEYRNLADACPPDLQAYQPQLRYLLLDQMQLACDGAACTLLTRQLACRFGPVPTAIGQRIAQASLQDLERWSLALLEAPDIGSVFANTQFAREKEKAAEAALPSGTSAS